MLSENIKKNLKAGITVSLISIPLSVSLAVTSGATPLIGIITAIWAGLIASIFGGSHFNVIGPTGALSGVVATYVMLHGVGGLPMLTVMVGVMIVIAYAVKLERYLILIPSSVIHGFTLGVAFIIGLGQLNFATGLQDLPPHKTLFGNTFESLRHIAGLSWLTTGIFIAFLVGLLLFRKYAPKLPGAILLTPVGIVLGYLSATGVIPFSLQTLSDKFGEINFSFFEMPGFGFSVYMIKTAAVVALIAILETMLSAKIADGMTFTKHNDRKEMLGLGLANVASGLFGGMPATAALARTSLNIKTGATHRTSGVINVVSIAIISMLLLGYFKYIPLAVIGAILVYISIQMVEKEHYEKLWKHEKTGFAISLVVAVVTVITDPMIGILLGVSISLIIFVDRIAHGHFNIKMNRFNEGIVGTASGVKLKEIKEDADVLLYSFRGKLCYINSRAHVERFEANLEKYKTIILRMREVYFMDMDGAEALDEIIDIIESRGQQVILSGIEPDILGLLVQLSNGYRELQSKGLVFEKSGDALRHLGILPSGEKPAKITEPCPVV